MIFVNYKTVEGFMVNKPALVDLTSCPNKVYLRKNISTVPNKDGNGNDLESTHWQYEEAILTLAEYEEYLAEIQSPSATLIMQTLSDIQLQLDTI